MRYLFSEETPFDASAERSLLLERKLSYSGELVSVRHELVASKVIPCWPKVGEAAVCPIVDFVDEHLVDDLANPLGCLLPESEWPLEVPRSRVHANDAEWYPICKAAVERDMFCEVAEDKLFRAKCGTPVLAGAMGVDKVKDVGGIPLILLRFICIFCPLNPYLRKMAGDSGLLPQAALLNNLILDDGEF